MNSMPTIDLADNAAFVDRSSLRVHENRGGASNRRELRPCQPAARGHVSREAVGDRDSLYAEFAPLVRRLLRQYGTDPELRQDLTGEIYWLFCSLVEAYDPERGVPLRPYLVRQLTASVYTYVRRQWTRKSREFSEDWSDTSSCAEPGYDPTSSWIAELSQQQVLATLPNAIAQLPDRQRKVLMWRYYDELPFEEIAELLAVEASTCRSLLRHALNNLRKQMQANG
jgi:RNA polymerase sigma factor (sigma-70 family)